MPEVPVDEDRDSGSREDNVWLAWEVTDVLPETKPSPMQGRPEGPLYCGIFAPYS